MQTTSGRSVLSTVNFLTGISDGLILPFWISAVAYPAFSADMLKMILTGSLVSLLGAVVFGFARYWGELNEIRHHHPELSWKETEKEQNLLRHIDIAQELRTDINKEMEKEKSLWLKEIRENDLDWEEEDRHRAMTSGLQTGLGFFSGACLVLIPVYLLICFKVITLSLDLSFFAALLLFLWPLFCLFCFSGFKAKYTGMPFWRGALNGSKNGMLALTIAFLAVCFLLKENL